MNEYLNNITFDIIGLSFKVHSALGPGLLEATYEACLTYELKKAGYEVSTQKSMPVIYEGIKLDIGYRVDLIVDDKVVVELKAVDAINDVHIAQLLTYMKLSHISVGLLINFNVTDLKKGIRRFVL